MQFAHVFKNEGETRFAFSYPFGYGESLEKYKEIVERFKESKSVYVCHETVVHSIEGRKMQLLTVSSFKGVTNEREDVIPDLFPEHSKAMQRPYR